LTLYYEGSHVRALMDLYPELNFCRHRFQGVKGNWVEVKNRRKFFDDYAKEKCFNPLIALNWYSVKYSDLIRKKGSHRVLAYYGHSYTKALMILYPEVVFDRQSFSRMNLAFILFCVINLPLGASWKDNQSRKEFFNSLLNSLQKWRPEYEQNLNKGIYSLRKETIINSGGRGILEYYNGSHIQALIELFPEYDLKVEHFVEYSRFS